MSLRRRVAAVTATIGRFGGQAFAWGSVDCARMAAFHLRQMGHSPRLAKAGSYKTLRGAVSALRRTGFASIEEFLDGLGLPRIPPAAALPADLLALPGDAGFSALQVVCGNGRVFGFHADTDLTCVIQPVLTEAIAWRVDPR